MVVGWNNSSALRLPLGAPMPRATEYVEMAYLTVLLALGGPLNLTAFTRLNSLRKQHIYTRLLYLKIHLNISDLMVVLIYVTSKLCWLLTFQWRGGAILCPVVNFAQFLSLAMSSNVIVCIALDRALTVFCKQYYTGYTPTTAQRNLKLLLTTAWVVAIASSMPQFWVWTVFQPWPSRDWKQCTTIWSIQRFINRESPTEMQYTSEKIYNAAHMLIVFWIPCCIVIVCYCLIFVWLCFFQPDCSAPLSQRTSVTRDTLWSPSTALSARPTPVILISVPPSNLEVTTLQRTRRKILRLTIILVGAYILCWMPYSTMALLMYIDLNKFSEANKTFYFFYSFVVLNSVINPFLYNAVQFPNIRCWLQRLCRTVRRNTYEMN